MNFNEFDLHKQVRSGLQAVGYDTPTPIQAQSLPASLAGRDVLGLAQTGTGKTAAFALPILHRLLRIPEAKRHGVVRALVVAPTRELAEQIRSEIDRLGQHTGLRSVSVYGGVGMNPQIKAQRGHADLTQVETLVLDEADHMFDMGFLPDVRRIVKAIPREAQRLLFSATMPDDLRRLADEMLSRPVRVEIGRRAPVETVDHAVYPVAHERKVDLLVHLLKKHDPDSALVFVRTKHGAKRLAQKLDRQNFFVTAMQGNLSQTRRQKALDGFRRGDFHIMVATDIAARGIDVTRVSHVINYDVPDGAEAYTHRIGRTGRAERSGDAFTLVTPQDESKFDAILRQLGTETERVVLDGFGGATPSNGSGSPGRGNGQTKNGSRNRRGRGRGGRNHRGRGSN